MTVVRSMGFHPVVPGGNVVEISVRFLEILDVTVIGDGPDGRVLDVEIVNVCFDQNRRHPRKSTPSYVPE